LLLPLSELLREVNDHLDVQLAVVRGATYRHAFSWDDLPAKWLHHIALLALDHH
jgi:hypothetical protein